MAFIYDLTDTWNAGGTTFNAIKMNVTDSASAAASRLISLQVGGAERFSVRKDGQGYFAGDVGIGTSSPVAYSGYSTLTIQNTNGGVINLRNGAATAQAEIAVTPAETYISAVSALPLTLKTTNTERMRITAAGDVLVGTTANPQNSKLMVGGTVQVKPATNNSLEILGPNTGTGIRLFARNDAGTPNRLELQGGQVIFPLTTGADGLYFDATSGNVGIGTSSPGTKLHAVGGNVWSSNFFEVGRFQRASGTGVSLGYDNSAYVATIGAYSHDGTASNLSFWTYPGSGSALERMRITAAGDVGIGTTSYVGKLSVSLGNATGFGAPPVWDNTYAIFGGTTANAAAVGIGFNSGIGGSITALSPGVAWHPMSYLASDHRFILAGSEAMRLNSAGNLGLGVTPSAWWASTRAFDLGANASLFSFASGANVQTGITNNAFINSSVQYVYKTSAAASNYLQNSGSHIWYTAPSGTAGNAISFTQAMTLDASGNLGIGTSSPQSQAGFGAFTANGSTGGAIFLTTANTRTAQFYNTDAITVLGSVTAIPLAFQTNNIERMRIDSSGNVGIGTTSPGARLDASRAAGASGLAGVIANPQLAITNPQNWGFPTGMLFRTPLVTGTTLVNNAAIWAEWSGDNNAYLGFATNGSGTLSERMRIDSSGNLLVGTTSGNSGTWTSGGLGLFVSYDRSGSSAVAISHGSGGASGDRYLGFGYNGTDIGSISQNGTTGVLYNTSSDARLKENVAPADDAAALIDAIQVRKFDWKADGSHQRYGMVAQELLEVAPEAVSVPADEDEMMGVDYSKLVPMLIKEVQSLRARVAQLEGN